MGAYNLVNIACLDPRIRLDLRYATADNFCKKKLYTQAACFLNKDCAQALKRVQDALTQEDLFLKVYDGYRPVFVQQLMWDLVQDETYVMNPAQGKGRHTRGTAVDLTLVNAAGIELEMPSQFDDFTERAHRESSLHSDNAKKHMKLLEKAMEAEGFIGWPFEWWHFDYQGWDNENIYPSLNVSFESLLAQ